MPASARLHRIGRRGLAEPAEHGGGRYVKIPTRRERRFIGPVGSLKRDVRLILGRCDRVHVANTNAIGWFLTQERDLFGVDGAEEFGGGAVREPCGAGVERGPLTQHLLNPRGVLGHPRLPLDFQRLCKRLRQGRRITRRHKNAAISINDLGDTDPDTRYYVVKAVTAP